MKRFDGMKVSQSRLASMDASTPVVVMKMYHYLGLGIARSLGRLGVEVHGIDPNPRSHALYSRYCSGSYVKDLDQADPDEIISFLSELSRKIGRRAVLYHTADEGAVFVAEHAKELSDHYIFAHQVPDLVCSLTSKKEMYFLAKRLGIPTAETLFPKTRTDVETSLDKLGFPLMLKGIDGLRLDNRTGIRMVIVRDKDHLLRQFDLLDEPGYPNLMLQEYIPGGAESVWMFNGYFNKNSDCLFGMTGKKLRQAPVYTGYTSLGICQPNEEVEQLTKRFMKQIGYKGILDIGYRFDERDGQYKVLDINPRIGATFRLFVAENGMDVARAAYLDLTGQEVPARSKPVPGRKWFVEDRDFVSCLHYRRDRKLTFLEWIRSFRGVKESAWFATDDLVPYLKMVSESLRKVFLPSTRSRNRLKNQAPISKVGAKRQEVTAVGPTLG